jgi:hypothetical protein
MAPRWLIQSRLEDEGGRMGAGQLRASRVVGGGSRGVDGRSMLLQSWRVAADTEEIQTMTRTEKS